MADKNPDYIGQFIVPWAPEKDVGPHTFWAYVIDSKQSQANSAAKLIKGKTKDVFGGADLDGIVSTNAVQFVKKYEDNSDGSKGPIVFQGETGCSLNGYPIQDYFFGQYFMDPRVTEGAVAIGPFVMFPFQKGRHPNPGKGELDIFTLDNMEEILRLSGHDRYKTLTGAGNMRSSLMITMGHRYLDERQFAMTSSSPPSPGDVQKMINAFEKKHQFS